jgi:hypothetical protein
VTILARLFGYFVEKGFALSPEGAEDKSGLRKNLESRIH